MSRQPISRIDLQQLKAKKDEQNRLRDEQNRLNQINQIVNQIYSAVVYIAETKIVTSYNYQIQQQQFQSDQPNKMFYDKNKDDIINGLKTLFPDCLIDYKMLSRGNDGKMYDITNIDEKMRPFINRQHDQAHIVVDWS
jgi:DNA repair ATPase RecN